jgi:hypothetical protein
MVSFIGAYLSLKFLGGFLVFGVGKSFADFSLFAIPVLSFPIALIAWWNVRLAGFLWALAMALFFGTQISLVWPAVHLVARNGTHFLAFLAGGASLLWGVILEADGRAGAFDKSKGRA